MSKELCSCGEPSCNFAGSVRETVKNLWDVLESPPWEQAIVELTEDGMTPEEISADLSAGLGVPILRASVQYAIWSRSKLRNAEAVTYRPVQL